jgi:CheY-like chemotaxis protein
VALPLALESRDIMGARAQRVLALDDDDTIRQAIRLVLEDEGYEVEEAADGVDALARLRASQEPLVALLDLLTPGISGLQVLQAVAQDKTLTTHHAYLAVSAVSQLPPEAVGLLTTLGVPFIAKPFDIDQLLALVDEAAHRLG